MSEILSAVRLKERIIIITLLTTLALLVGGASAAITIATTDRHQHNYEFYLNKCEDSSFEFVGVCTFERCEDPYYVRPIVSGVYESVKTPATCYSEGEKEYSFTFREKPTDEPVTYIYTEVIPMVSHYYVGEVEVKNGIASAHGKCRNEGCSAEIGTNNAADIALVETIDATCHSYEEKIYSLTYSGAKINLSVFGTTLAEHSVNGEYISSFRLNEDGVIKYGTANITAVADDGIGCGGRVLGIYMCDVCRQTQRVTLGLPDHVFVYSDENTVMPTMLNHGHTSLKCTNEGCTDTVEIDIPTAVEGENTFETDFDHILESRFLTYTYYNESFGFTVETVFVLPKVDHTLVYVVDDTVLPTETEDGIAYARCTFEGCTKHEIITIPKIDATAGSPDKNSVILSGATELKRAVAKYSYTNGKYGFTVEFETEIGTVLSHNYKYQLEFYTSVSGGVSEMVLIGRCRQVDCCEPVVYDFDTVVTLEEREATCVSYACFVYSCVKDGVRYETVLEDKLAGYGDHKLACVQSETIAPTLETEGVAIIRCSNEGCDESHEVIIPKMIIGENSVSEVNPETGMETITYTYTDPEWGFTITTTLERVEIHDHVYEYTLEPMIETFDLVGVCKHPACEESVRVEDVPAIMIDDSTTCTEPGKQTWTYDYEGATYTCYIFTTTVFGHSMYFDVEADSTVMPSFDSVGYIQLYCYKCGELGELVELPEMVLGENTTLFEETPQQTLYRYIYSTVYDDHNFDIVLYITHKK